MRSRCGATEIGTRAGRPCHRGYFTSSTRRGRYLAAFSLNLPWQTAQQKATVLDSWGAVNWRSTGLPVRGHLVLTALAAGLGSSLGASALTSTIFAANLAGSLVKAAWHLSQQKATVLVSWTAVKAASTALPLTGQTALTGLAAAAAGFLSSFFSSFFSSGLASVLTSTILAANLAGSFLKAS